MLTAHITEKPRPPIDVRPEIGREINAVVMKALEKDPKARYANAGELLHALDSLKMPQAAAAAGIVSESRSWSSSPAFA